MSINSFHITKFNDDSVISAQSFNTPLNQIQKYLNSIMSDISLLNNKSAIIQSVGFVDASVKQGDLVYFDTKDNVFKSALARLAGIPGSQGQSVQAQSCRVQGLVVAKDNSGIKILRQGYYENSIIASTLQSSQAQPGLYYLSAVNPGKAVLDPAWNMRQPCISYYGNNKFSVMTNYLAHDSHHHATFVIQPKDPNWNSKEYQIPLSANLGYMSKDVTAIFVDGVLDTNFDIRDTSIKYEGSLPIEQKKIVIFNNFPFAYGAGLLRSMSTNSKQLNVKNNNGYVQIDFIKPTQSQLQYTGRAISYINDNNQIITTPVVSRIEPGLNIQVKAAQNGVYSIGSNVLSATRLIASDITCKGAKYIVDNLLTYVLFPGSSSNSTTSSAIAFIHLNNAAKSNYTAKFWCIGRGSGALTINYYWMTQATQIIRTPTEPDGTASVSVTSSDGNWVSIQSSQSIEIPGNTMPGTLMIQITNTSSATVQMLKCGCYLQLKSSNPSKQSIDPADIGKAPIIDRGNYFNQDTVQGALNQLGQQLHGVADIMSDIVGQ